LKEQFQAQQERKLAETVKIVEVLGKKIAQKTKLENTIGNIDSFTIAQSVIKTIWQATAVLHVVNWLFPMMTATSL